MPQRFLRPGLTNSAIWNGVGFPAQSLFVRLLTLVDDYGRYDGRASVIWAHSFAVWNELHPETCINPQEVAGMLQEIAGIGLVTLYTAENKQVLQINQWNERIREGTKEKWPKNDNSGKFLRNPAESCGILPPSPSPSSPPSPSPSLDKRVASLPGAPKVSRFEKPSREQLELQAAKIGLPLAEVDKFLNHYESNGWKVGKNPMKSWTHALSNWKANLANYSNQSAPAVRIGPTLAEVKAYAAEKWPAEERHAFWAASFFGFWAGKKWLMRGQAFDWQEKLTQQVAKWRA